jgi:hypothetical protein
MPTVEFEPTISAGKRPQIYALYRAATGTGTRILYENKIRPRRENRGVKKKNKRKKFLF